MRYDRLQAIDAGVVVEHKRLNHALQVAQLLQAQRDDPRAAGTPSRTHAGAPVRPSKPAAGTKRSRRFTVDDLHCAIEQLSTTPA